jgi:hypothetical protein
MVRGGGRLVAASIATLVGVLFVPTTASATASGGGSLHLQLSSSAGLRAGQSIDYAVTGPALVPGRVLEVWQCDADAELAIGATLNDLNRSCTGLDGRTIPERGRRVTGSVTVQEVFTTYPLEPEPQGAVHCGDEPDDCLMVAVMRADDPEGHIDALDAVRIDVVPSPVAVGGAGLVDSSGAVQVWLAGTPDATLRLAQCVRFPGVSRAIEDCREGPTVTLSHRGRATTMMPVVPTLEVDGTIYDCRTRPCEVTAFDATGTIVGSAGIPGSVPYAEVTLDRSTGLVHGDIIQARVDSAIPAGSAYIALCLASALEDLPASEACYVYFPVAGPGVHEYGLIVYEHFVPYGGGPEVSCTDDPGGCAIAVGTAETTSGLAWISFAAPAGALI